MSSIKHILIVVLICLGLTLFSFSLHIFPGTNTMINYIGPNQVSEENLIVSDGFLPWAVDYHQQLLEFKKRPVAVFLMEKFSKIFNVRISLAYVYVNFFFFFLGGLLIYYLARLYQYQNKEALLGIVFYFFSFSILLAYFIPIATFDEPVQYFFILLAFIALQKQKYVMFVIMLTLAAITRETSLLLLPVMVLFFMRLDIKKMFSNKIQLVKVAIYSGLPVLFYVIYSIWFYKTNPQLVEETKFLLDQKFKYYKTKNFLDFEHTMRTILSFVSVNLLPIFLIFYYKLRNKFNDFESKLLTAFWIMFWINLVMVIVSAYAEESRVFTLPYLILFPMYGKILKGVIQFNKSFFNYLLNWKSIVIIFITGVFSWNLFKIGYQLTNFKPHENLNLFVEYNTLVIIFIVLIFFYNRFSFKTELPKQ
ncbi:MAG: hypothetical protein AB7O47_00305 [Flavobacteriales bacterium]